MATYTDIDDLRARFYLVQDDEVAERILNRAAVMAYNLINSYLDGIYGVPFSTTPVEIKDISDLITRVFAQSLTLKQQIVINSGENSELKDAISWLMDVRSGKASLVGYSRLTTRGPRHSRDGYTRIFDLDPTECHEVDPDYLESVLTERDS